MAQTSIQKNCPNILEKLKKISGPNGLSKCPESIEIDFGHFRGTYFSTCVGHFFGPTFFFENMDLGRVLWPKCQVKNVSYVDPLVMKFSLKSDLCIGNVYQVFSFLVKPYFLFLQYRESVPKKTQIFRHLFEPCASCVDVDSLFFQRKTISGKKDPR